jgi:hypothetical protein
MPHFLLGGTGQHVARREQCSFNEHKYFLLFFFADFLSSQNQPKPRLPIIEVGSQVALEAENG